MSRMETVKANKREFVITDPSKCNGCGICELACALEKEGTLNPLRSRIRIMRLHPLVNVTVACRFCDDAPCVKACPRDALVQSDKNSVIIIDEEKCDACGWCIPACQYGAILLHPEKKVVMACDLCDGDPKCIEFCPEEALELITDDAAAQSTLVSALDKQLSEAEKIIQLIQTGMWAEIFLGVDEKINKSEEKLKALHKKELETYTES